MSRELRRVIHAVIDDAIKFLAESDMQVYTFALYYDHESPAISACIDTTENSARHVAEQNTYSLKYFTQAIANGDLGQATLWSGNSGRNFSLGDFATVNLGRVAIDETSFGDEECIEMVKQLRSREQEILKYSRKPSQTVFCCTSPTDEVGLVWGCAQAAA